MVRDDFPATRRTHVTPNQKIALFIDGANLYATAKTLGFDIDYKRLLREFLRAVACCGLFDYTAVIEDQEYSSIRPADRLARLQRLHVRHQGDQGFRRPDRPPQGQGQHGHRACGRCHGTRRHIDQMVLFSGDGDFRSLVEAVQRRGVRVWWSPPSRPSRRW